MVTGTQVLKLGVSETGELGKKNLSQRQQCIPSHKMCKGVLTV